ncbi:MAG: hypothetical protein NC434_01760 [Ruminococcus sp.]|nr:hypothetical protein [Ruminococcus sp.]
MKRSFIILLLSALMMTGCGKETLLLTEADYALNLQSNTTSKGIGIGDTPEAFLEAYSGYNIETTKNGGSYQALPDDEIPFEEPIKTILPTFFINGVPATIEQICEENGIQRLELLPLLSSEEYLQDHTVTYHYIVFSWENGVITDIRSEYMDYNEDASYYEELEKEELETGEPETEN